ncbi:MULTISPECIES: MinD/ParA family ATP-binding protein [Brachybacterium]|uniref:Chromosome partitioning protein n=3 Tax=Brachybacterium TaxID=43668 RepID=A0A426SIJ0_9MICO|nr:MULTISPECIES: chromosome partitioning protein [Brachybacterium]RRR17962.1 chromosome partitioning protein [Brachybacterium paraconglomeratum]GLI29283.1 chromosome partitioning protein [Brachybacterium conglomeratum]GLK05613.1 chromosome partitioning protein [Brachybacterium conglomeratum]
MIAQARITSETTATVHLADESVEVSGADLPEIRDRVKQVFITSAKSADEELDVVIVEPDVRHHLRVEPSGRISPREADDRPLFGPGADDPLIAPPLMVTGEQPAVDAEGAPAARPHRARRRRAAAKPPSTVPGSAGGSAESTGEHAAVTTGEHARISPFAPEAGDVPVAGVAPSAAASSASAPSAVASASSSAASAASASSAASAPSARSARSAPSAPSAVSAPSAPSAVSAPSAPSAAPAPSSPGVSAPAPSAASSTPAAKRPLPSRATVPADGRPTLQDLQSSTAKHRKVKATRGFRGVITRATRGVISPGPGKKERLEIERLERIRRPLDGPRNIAVVNLKGGAHKTTASLMIAATLGVSRGGNVLAWDNNETRGTLGWRGVPTEHHRTAVDLLHDIESLRSPSASNADLDPYVRPQGEMRFDILASDEDPGSAALIDDHAFGELDEALSRFYRIKVIDTGNNVRASNWLAAVKSADQLVIISTVREDTFNAAAWMIDELRATGLGEQVDHAVTILSHSSKGKFDPTLRSRLLAHFGAHTRAVAEVPYEQQFVDGTHLDWSRVSKATKKAWLDATALIVDGL